MRWRRSVGWEPRDLGWWVAVLFMVGSFLFALGSLPLYAQVADPHLVATTFFVGSLWFTSAALCQLVQTVGSSGLLVLACVVQAAGTVLFNISTFEALQADLSVPQENRLVWAPDAFGSIAFLLASHLAWMAVCAGWWAWRTGSDEWWVAALNYLGSIFFGLSAVGALTLPDGDLVSVTLVNTGTFLGAVCFLLGAYLLRPAATRIPVA